VEGRLQGRQDADEDIERLEDEKGQSDRQDQMTQQQPALGRAEEWCAESLQSGDIDLTGAIETRQGTLGAAIEARQPVARAPFSEREVGQTQQIARHDIAHVGELEMTPVLDDIQQFVEQFVEGNLLTMVAWAESGLLQGTLETRPELALQLFSDPLGECVQRTTEAFHLFERPAEPF
jgi:hypothetical protein